MVGMGHLSDFFLWVKMWFFDVDQTCRFTMVITMVITMVYCNIRIAYGLLCGSTYGLLWYYEAFNSNTTELYGLLRGFVCPISQQLGPRPAV